MSENFSFGKKKKLVERIQKLTDKNDLMKIKKIIIDNNPDLGFMKNSNGYFMQFQNLSDDTYKKLTEFLDEKDIIDNKKEFLKIESELAETEELLSANSASISKEPPVKKIEKSTSKKLRLTNAENHLLNRKKYENELIKNEKNENDIFIHTTENKSKKKNIKN